MRGYDGLFPPLYFPSAARAPFIMLMRNSKDAYEETFGLYFLAAWSNKALFSSKSTSNRC